MFSFNSEIKYLLKLWLLYLKMVYSTLIYVAPHFFFLRYRHLFFVVHYQKKIYERTIIQKIFEALHSYFIKLYYLFKN